MSVPLNGNLGFTSSPEAVVNKPAPSLPVICVQYCGYILTSLAVKHICHTILNVQLGLVFPSDSYAKEFGYDTEWATVL